MFNNIANFLRHSGATFHAVLFGMIFFFCGGLFLFLMLMRTEVVCVQTEPGIADCTLQSFLMGFYPLTPRPVNGVTGAELSESCDSDGCTYRVDLLTRHGDNVPLQNYYTSYEDNYDKTVSAINAYLLSSSTTEFRRSNSMGIGGFTFVPLLFIVVGLSISGVAIGKYIFRLTGGVTVET